MDDLRSTRPERSSGVERYTSKEKQSTDKPSGKKLERSKRISTPNPSTPQIDELGDAQDHQLDERA